MNSARIADFMEVTKQYLIPREGYNEPSDPFATDIYYLGNIIKGDFWMWVKLFSNATI